MLASNDYLGLSTDPVVVRAVVDACSRYGTGLAIYPVFVISEDHQKLESELAAFLGVEAVLLTASGGAANAAALTGLVGRGDLVLSDADNHASTIDAGRLSRAEVRPYLTRNPRHLDELLAMAASNSRRLVISNGVFSMDGGIAPLAEIAEICVRHNAMLVVDDAHGTGVVGDNGKGSLSASGLLNNLPGVFVTGSLSKALGGAGGGFLGGPRGAIDDLRKRARSYVFTQGMTSAATAAALAALRRHIASPVIHQSLLYNIDTLKRSAERLGLDLLPSESAVQTLLVGQEARAMEIQARLLDRGLFVQAMTNPIVPEGQARLRLQPTAAHDPNDLELAISMIADELMSC